MKIPVRGVKTPEPGTTTRQTDKKWVTIPPFRERIDDIPALVQHFIRKKSRDMKLTGIPTLAPGAIDRLMAYHWPGNVRELENAVERALILSRGEPLTFSDLQP